MTRYLISFDDGAMAHIPLADLPAVGERARAVVRDAKAAGAWVHGAGVHQQRATLVGTDGSIAEGPLPEAKAVIGGFSIINVATREQALSWAARFAMACQCTQEVRELMDDPEA